MGHPAIEKCETAVEIDPRYPIPVLGKSTRMSEQQRPGDDRWALLIGE
jgi:hypothetical protein